MYCFDDPVPTMTRSLVVCKLRGIVTVCAKGNGNTIVFVHEGERAVGLQYSRGVDWQNVLKRKILIL